MIKGGCCLLIKIIFIRMTASKKQPCLSYTAYFTLHYSVSLTLMLPVLQEPNEGGNPCTRSNHDDWHAGVVWEVEWIEDSRKDWNLKNEQGAKHYSLVSYPGLSMFHKLQPSKVNLHIMDTSTSSLTPRILMWHEDTLGAKCM